MTLRKAAATAPIGLPLLFSSLRPAARDTNVQRKVLPHPNFNLNVNLKVNLNFTCSLIINCNLQL